MNPFKVLNIDPDSSKPEIIRAVALGMRERKYSAHELARAQKMLLDPVSAAVQTFLHCIDLGPFKAQLDIKDPDPVDRVQMLKFNRLDTFDERS